MITKKKLWKQFQTRIEKKFNSEKKFEIWDWSKKNEEKLKQAKKEEKLDKINKKYWFGLSIEWKTKRCYKAINIAIKMYSYEYINNS